MASSTLDNYFKSKGLTKVERTVMPAGSGFHEGEPALLVVKDNVAHYQWLSPAHVALMVSDSSYILTVDHILGGTS